MNVVVLGDTGMLGGMLRRYLEEVEVDVIGVSRKDGLAIHPVYHTASFLNKIPALLNPDYIINCIGAIKPVFNDKNRLTEAIYTNAIFPHELIGWNHRFEVGAKIIHITTDCVFDGRDGYYTEVSPHNPLDEYGKSKSLGEPEDCMVIRTSIIGPEWGGNKRSLVEWVLSQRGKEINGFTNHMWNGLTTLELSMLIADIMMNDLYYEGIQHLFSNDVNKYELLKWMNRIWDLGIKVNKAEADTSCNRTLRTTKKLNGLLQPQTTFGMLENLKPYIVGINV